MIRIRLSRKSAGIACLTLVATIAAGIVLFAGSSSNTAQAGTWSWGAGVPGDPVAVNQTTATVARLGGVDAATVRQVTGASILVDGRQRTFNVLAASGPAGQTCLSLGGTEFARSFHCADEIGQQPFVENVIRGGSEQFATDWIVIVGVARSDVARVSVTLPSGATRDLPLNKWRGFAYVAGSRGDLPQTLAAYGADGGQLVERNIRNGN